jgi:hypothetical protein
VLNPILMYIVATFPKIQRFNPVCTFSSYQIILICSGEFHLRFISIYFHFLIDRVLIAILSIAKLRQYI